MKIIYSIIFGSTLFLLHFSEGVFAAMSMDEVCGKIRACITSSNPASITEYACIKGSSMLGNTSQSITTATIAFSAYTSIRFQEIDADIRKDMGSLQKLREEKGISWIEYISAKRKEYEARYAAVCTELGGPLNVLTACQIEASTDAYPQTSCLTLAGQKAKSWENVSYMIASKGIAKNYQNAKDVHIDSVKGKYARLLEKFQRYQRIVGTAVSKFRAYVSDPIGQ